MTNSRKTGKAASSQAGVGAVVSGIGRWFHSMPLFWASVAQMFRREAFACPRRVTRLTKPLCAHGDEVVQIHVQLTIPMNL